MKSGIHPNYEQSVITCACGSVVNTYSTRGSFTTDVCFKCHPFYTGKRLILDTAGRVERFRRKYANNPGGPTGMTAQPESTESAEPAKPAE